MISNENDIATRMENIMRIFNHAATIAAQEKNIESLLIQLDLTENKYRSVAYEAASMSIASGEIENNNDLIHWNLYRNLTGSKHASQVHSGFGWALAKKKIQPDEYLKSIEPLLQLKVIDGWGYYDGIFRRRFSIAGKNIPEEISESILPGYDQGLGRALYYQCKGEIEKLPSLLTGFKESRLANLWRGIGMACSYVGGCSEKKLNDLLTMAEKNHHQLLASAALVALARYDADALTASVDNTCRVWCRRSTKSVIDIANETAKENLYKKDAYLLWMNSIIEKLSNVNSSVSE